MLAAKYNVALFSAHCVSCPASSKIFLMICLSLLGFFLGDGNFGINFSGMLSWYMGWTEFCRTSRNIFGLSVWPSSASWCDTCAWCSNIMQCDLKSCTMCFVWSSVRSSLTDWRNSTQLMNLGASASCMVISSSLWSGSSNVFHKVYAN